MTALFVVFTGIIGGVLLIVATAAVRATLLCIPVMLILGALSTSWAVVPALGIGASWLLVALLSLLLPLGNRVGKHVKSAED